MEFYQGMITFWKFSFSTRIAQISEKVTNLQKNLVHKALVKKSFPK